MTHFRVLSAFGAGGAGRGCGGNARKFWPFPRSLVSAYFHRIFAIHASGGPETHQKRFTGVPTPIGVETPIGSPMCASVPGKEPRWQVLRGVP